MNRLIARGYKVTNEAIDEYPKVKMIVSPEGKIIRRNVAAEEGANIIWLASKNAAEKPAFPKSIVDHLTTDMLNYVRSNGRMTK